MIATLHFLLLLTVTISVATAFNIPILEGLQTRLRSGNNLFASSTLSSPLKTRLTDSEELLSLLLRTKADPLASPTENDRNRIEFLMQSLQNEKIAFDPKKCLNGPLFAALYQTGPPPFWEKFDFGSAIQQNKQLNIKGQRYTLNEGGDYDVFNYAEFLGQNLRAQGVGVCRKNAIKASSNEINVGNDAAQEGNIFANLFKNSKLQNDSNSPLVKCPADYTIQVTGASISLFNNRFDFNIQGTGYLRVLYADENLRIFTTPKNTDSTLDLIDEVAGLTVVQVRVDLFDPDFTIP